jgi:plastocyanin
MRRRHLLTILGGVVILGAIFVFAKNGDQPEQKLTSEGDKATQAEQQPSSVQFSFSTPKKSAHYETNTPEHGSVLAAPPINIVINFNFDLAPPSSMSITKDGKEYGVGNLVIDTNKLSMRRNFDSTAPDGLYKVAYNACWPDRSCHDGHFEFAIDRTKASNYEDMTGRKEITVKMSEVSFKPMDIKVSAGTKVTWINDENVEHYINTDSHPAHTYYPDQNSRALKLGESYSVTFSKAGIYPYHCSAHESTMRGNIIVI